MKFQLRNVDNVYPFLVGEKFPLQKAAAVFINGVYAVPNISSFRACDYEKGWIQWARSAQVLFVINKGVKPLLIANRFLDKLCLFYACPPFYTFVPKGNQYSVKVENILEPINLSKWLLIKMAEEEGIENNEELVEISDYRR